MDKPIAPTKQSTPVTNNTNPSFSLLNFDENTKAYIDAACQASSNMIISTIKKYIDQTLDAYIVLINKLNEYTAATHNHTFNLSSTQQTNRPNDSNNIQQ
ncbi:12036_t:CDS:2, partial [Racocetra persica]